MKYDPTQLTPSIHSDRTDLIDCSAAAERMEVVYPVFLTPQVWNTVIHSDDQNIIDRRVYTLLDSFLTELMKQIIRSAKSNTMPARFLFRSVHVDRPAVLTFKLLAELDAVNTKTKQYRIIISEHGEQHDNREAN